MILLVHWPPHEMDCATTIWAATDGTVRVTQNNTVNVTQIYGGWECRSSRNYCKDIVSPHSCYCAFTQIYAVARPVSWTLSLEASWRHGFTAAWKSGGEAGATHVQISWISAWIPSEVTRTFFFDLPIWDSNSSSFSCRSFSSQREPTVVGSIKYMFNFHIKLQMYRRSSHWNHRFITRSIDHQKYKIRRHQKHTTLAYLATRHFISSRVSTVAQYDISIFKGFFAVVAKVKERPNGSPPSGQNVEKESQQQYEQKRKRRFQKKWIEEFDGMDITKYPSDQNKHTTLMQNTNWST